MDFCLLIRKKNEWKMKWLEFFWYHTHNYLLFTTKSRTSEVDDVCRVHSVTLENELEWVHSSIYIYEFVIETRDESGTVTSNLWISDCFSGIANQVARSSAGGIRIKRKREIFIGWSNSSTSSSPRIIQSREEQGDRKQFDEHLRFPSLSLK